MSLANLQTLVGVTVTSKFDPVTYKAAAAYFKLSKFRAAHFFGQCATESGNFTAFRENLNYSAKGLRGTFGKYFPGNLSETYAKQPERIANRAYANRNGNGPESSGDGWKFRGRGAIQLTGRSNYQKFADYIKDQSIMSNPDLVATKYAFDSALFFFDTHYSGPLWRICDEGVNSDTILRLTKRINGGTNGLSERQQNTYKFLKYETVAIDPNERRVTQTQATPANNQTSSQTGGETNQSQEPISQEKSTSDSQDQQQQAAQGPIEQIKQIFPPTIKPSEISIELKGTSEADKQNIAQTLGFNPTLFYNGVQISAQSTINFKLSHESLVPRIDATIFDTYGIFKKSGIPGDGTIISLFLSSRSKYLKSFRIDFKIIDFKELSGSKYRLSAIINAPKLYTKQFTSLGSLTTLEALKEIAKQCGLGFSTNINSTNDRQNWINVGESYLDFIKKIVDKSYISDQSFQVCYIDYYYNLVYVDLSKEFDRNIKEDVGITGTGFDELTKGSADRTEIDDKISSLILTTDRNLGLSTNFIDKFNTVNNSTAISVSQAYRNEIKYLDISKKELLYFKNDPQTSDASKTQVLRATAGNDEFFNEHTASTYTGKIDGFEDSGNSHTNIGFTSVNNKRNLIELAKYSAKSILPKYNFNLYPFRKVAVQVLLNKPTPDQPEGFDVRLTGEWLITSLEFRWNQRGTSMHANMIKRDLSLSPNEQAEGTAPKPDQNNFKTEPNPMPEAGPAEQSSTQVQNPTGATESAPLTNSTVPTGPLDLEYVIGDPVLDNDKRPQTLVVIDGKVITESTGRALIALKKAAALEGFTLTLNSGFRPPYGSNSTRKTNKGNQISITTQQSIRSDKSRWRNRSSFQGTDLEFILNASSSNFSPQTGKPGKSNHGNGIAVDLNTGSRSSGNLNTKLYVWLLKNASKYGFVRTVGSEEWHFEYYPELINKSPYSKLANTNANKFFSDLGLDKLA